MRRKNLGKGLGKGYYNIIPNYDSYIHSLSACGIKSKPKTGKVYKNIPNSYEVHKELMKDKKYRESTPMSREKMLEEEIDRQMEELNAKKSIMTVKGEANYVKTEVEDENGRWNDNYSTKDGYYVIHEGDKHHVYSVNKMSPNQREKFKEEYGNMVKDMNRFQLNQAIQDIKEKYPEKISLNAKGEKFEEKKDFGSFLKGDFRRKDFGSIPTPQKRGLIKEIARKVHDGVDWAVQWEKEHLPKQKAWVKKEFNKGKELAKKGIDKAKKVEKKAEKKVKEFIDKEKQEIEALRERHKDLQDVRDELDTDDDGDQDISMAEFKEVNDEIMRQLDSIDLDRDGTPDHKEDGTFDFKYPKKPIKITPDDEPIEPPMPEKKEKTIPQKIASGIGTGLKTGYEEIERQIEKRRYSRDILRGMPDTELEHRAIAEGNTLFGGLNKFEKEILRRAKERKKIAKLKQGIEPEREKGGGFLAPLPPEKQLFKPKKTD